MKNTIFYLITVSAISRTCTISVGVPLCSIFCIFKASSWEPFFLLWYSDLQSIYFAPFSRQMISYTVKDTEQLHGCVHFSFLRHDGWPLPWLYFSFCFFIFILKTIITALIITKTRITHIRIFSSFKKNMFFFVF